MSQMMMQGQQQPQAPLIDSKGLITTNKGWDVRIFRDEQLAKRFVCAICQNVCRNPHELSCSNAHLFCELCISEYSNNNNVTTCPLDHEMNVSHQASRFVTRHIEQLYTFCPRSKVVCSKLTGSRYPNTTMFCNFQGTLKDLMEHVEHACMFNVIACPFHLIGCPTDEMYRFQLQSHINNAQNKHVSLALQKIQSLQHSLKQKEDSNEIYQEQLKALKIASHTKDDSLNSLTTENDKLKINHRQLMHECNRLSEELKGANQRIESYSKAVTMLKENNSKLAEQVDDLNASSMHQQSMNHMSASYASFGQSPQAQQAQQPPQAQIRSSSGYGADSTVNSSAMGSQDIDQTELSNQFSSLLSMQRQNAQNYNQNSSMLNGMQATSGGVGGGSNGVAQGLAGMMGGRMLSGAGGDDKQPNSTDVVCAFLKEHTEIVNKLKNSNQIMYANIITDDKYAAQFLKKMLQSGNQEYRTEISAIVQRLSQ